MRVEVVAADPAPSGLVVGAPQRDDRVVEIDRATLRVGDPAVIEHLFLQRRIETKLACALISGEVHEGSELTFTVRGDELAFGKQPATVA